MTVELLPLSKPPIRKHVPVTSQEQIAADLRKSGLLLKEVGERMNITHQNTWRLLRNYCDKTGYTSVMMYRARKTDEERMETKRARHRRAALIYAERHPEHIRVHKKEYRHKNIERFREKATEWRKKNPERVKFNMDAWRQVPKNRMRSIVNCRIADAKRRGILVDPDALYEFVKHPPTHCAISGIALDYSVAGGRGVGHSPSIDRIRPSLGYTKGNVAVISHRINTIKSFGTADEHRMIADYLDRIK